MKLLFFISSLGSGGAERVMSVITNELANRGYDITLAIMTKSPQFYSLHPKIKVKEFPFQYGKNIFGKVKNRFNFLRFIRMLSVNEKPDVIISFIYQMNTSVLLSTLFLNTPVIACEHNTLDRKMSFIEKLQRFYISKLADKLTVLTNHDFNFIGSRLSNKVVMPNPLPFDPVEILPVQKEKVVVAVGSIKRYKHKGFDNLVEIWSIIGNKFPDWKLKIAGGFDDESIGFLKSLEIKYNNENKIEFLGQVRDITTLLQRSSVFILTSRWEGFPMVLMEAMSQGCACISYDLISGPNEMITHGVDGILVENQNKEEMIRQLSILMESQEKRQFLAINATKSIKRFSVESIINKWEKVLTQVSMNEKNKE